MCVVPTPGGADTVNRIVAIVNDEVITEADVAAYLDALLEDSRVTVAPDADAAQMQQEVLRRLIDHRLMLQEAKRLVLTVDSVEVSRRLEGMRRQIGPPDVFRAWLAEQGLSEDRVKQQLQEQLLVQRVVDARVRATIVVSPQEVANELARHPELAKPGDRVRASHILIRVNESRSAQEARRLVEELHGQLARGADFAELARRDSEDPNSEEGGVMDWVAPGELLPELDEALFRLGVGELSSPIQTRVGFHLVKVEERRPASSLSLMEANRAIHQRLYQEKFEDAFRRWVEELNKKAYIEILTSS
jgi:parvulin-like peptidyl-prolyl isomerase